MNQMHKQCEVILSVRDPHWAPLAVQVIGVVNFCDENVYRKKRVKMWVIKLFYIIAEFDPLLSNVPIPQDNTLVAADDYWLQCGWYVVLVALLLTT